MAGHTPKKQITQSGGKVPTGRPAAGLQPAKGESVGEPGRTVHLIILTDETGAILRQENFSAELAARRELDFRPDWKYLGLRPGQVYVAAAGVVAVEPGLADD